MHQLTTNWFTEGIIDFEHKKYLLLAYLQYISKQFDETKLYPFLSDLVFHYQNIKSLKDNRAVVLQKMPKKLRKFDLDKFRLEYEEIMNDDACMTEIEAILDFALPALKNFLNDGKEIYNFVEKKLEINPVGIVPLNKEEGYFMLQNGHKSDTEVFEFKLSFFENASEKFRSIQTKHLLSYQPKISWSFEAIKLDLIRSHKKFPNPATYVVRSLLPFPFGETLLPIAKRSLVRFIAVS